MKKDLALRLGAFILIAALLSGIVTLHRETREVTKGYPDEYRSYYIPSSAQARAFSLGYHNAAADIIYIWFLQFYDWYNKSVRYSYMVHTFDVMTDLDHKRQEFYTIAALFAFIPLKYDLVYYFLDKGIEKNRENYIIPYDAGCYAFFSEKNYDRAAKYFEIAYQRNPDRGTIKNLYAKSLARKGDLDTALEYFRELYAKYKDDNSAEGNYYRVAAANHLWRTVNLISERDVGAAINAFKEKNGKNPSRLQELVRGGFIAELPRDPLGKEYGYDPVEGKILCESKFDIKAVAGRW